MKCQQVFPTPHDTDRFRKDIEGIFIKFQGEIKLRGMTCQLITQDTNIP